MARSKSRFWYFFRSSDWFKMGGSSAIGWSTAVEASAVELSGREKHVLMHVLRTRLRLPPGERAKLCLGSGSAGYCARALVLCSCDVYASFELVVLLQLELAPGIDPGLSTGADSGGGWPSKLAAS